MEFTDVQRAPRTLSIVLLVSGLVSLAFVGLIVFLFEIQEPATDGNPWAVLIGLAALHTALYLLFTSSRLSITVDDEGVRIRFAPFHRSGRFIPWSDVRRITLRPVNAFGEFGGWGIRWNFGRRLGYVWNARTGMQLDLADGRSVVITIGDMDGLRDVVHDRLTRRNTSLMVDDRFLTAR
jgi:hypothetical protein